MSGKIDISKLVDHVYIINLDHRTDRWEKIMEMLNRWVDSSSNSVSSGDRRGEWYERFSACVPRLGETDPRYYKHYTINPKLQQDKTLLEKYLIGATGCKMSHVNIIKDAKRRGFKKILILEDDACQPPGLSANKFLIHFRKMMGDLEGMNKPWWMCYLGGKNVGDYRMVGKKIAKITGIKTTHAYLIHHRCFDLVIDNMMPSGLEADVFYLKLHRMVDCFRVVPGLLIQREDFSDILGKKVKYSKVN